MRLRLALTVLALALLATVAWVYGDQFLGGGGGDLPVAGGDATGQDPVTKGEKPGAEAAKVVEAGAAKRARLTAPEQGEAVHTGILRGRFVAPTGVWPGGGRVALFPAPAVPEGGAMGLFAAGMQANRSMRKGKAKGKARAGLPSWMEPGVPVRSADLDLEGGFVLRDLPAGLFLVRIQHPHLMDAGKVEVEIRQGKHIDLGEVPTRIAGSLLVLVADPAGKPVAGAHLELRKEMDMSTFMKPRASMDVLGMIRSMFPLSAKTDARGAHVFEGLSPETSWTLEVSCSHLVDEHRPVAVLPGRQNLVQVELSRGAELELQVLDPDGKPRPFARLKVTFPDLKKPPPVVGMGVRAGGEAVSKSGVADTEGRRHLDGLPPGRCVVDVADVGFLRQPQELVLKQSTVTKVTIRLERGATISGQVVDEEGNPVPEARVKHTKSQGFSILGLGFSDILDQVQAMEVEHSGLKVEADGRFVLGGMGPNEAVELMAVAPGFDGRKSRRVHAGTTGVVIRLQRQATLRGVVRAAESGAVIPAFSVKVQKRSFMVMDVPLVTEEFQDREDGSFLVEDVPRGRYEVVVAAQGRAASSQNVSFDRGGEVDIGEVRLELPAAVAGLVLDPDGAPVSDASVRAGKGGQMDSFVVAQVMGQKLVKTDAGGRFRLEGLSGSKVRLLVDKEGFAPLRSESLDIQKGTTTEGVTLVLGKGGSIKGRLVNAQGRPLEGWIAQATHTTGLGVEVTQTDADGRFLLRNLAPGTHKVDCMPGDYMSRFSGGENAGNLAPDNLNLGKMMTTIMKFVVSERVVVRAGEETEVEIEFQEPAEEAAARQDLVTVEGRVRLGGRDLEEGLVLVFEEGATVQSHLAHVHKGAFSLRDVRPGHYRLRVQASVFSGPLGQPKRVLVPDRGPYTLLIDLPAGRLSGKVVYAEDGKPAGGVVLSLKSAGDRNLSGDRLELGEGTQIADSEGRFQFRGLDAGTYHLLAKEVRSLSGSGGQSGHLRGIRLRESEHCDGLVLQIEKGGTILVKVTDATGPRANALVTLLAADGTPVDLFHRALTEPDGTVTLRGIPGGSYRVNVDAPKSAARVSEPIDIDSGAEREVTVSLPPGIPAFLELGKSAADHAGEVLRYSIWRGDGVLIRSGRVVVPRDLEAFLRSTGGRLAVGTFEPGRYRVRVEGPRLGTIEVEREVPPKGSARWQL